MKMRDRMEPVIFVDTKGRARLSQTVEGVALDTSVTPAERRAAQEAALRAMMSQNTAPEECGPAILRHAPARGMTVPFTDTALHQRADGTSEVRDTMWQGRQGMRRADAFDRMAQAAAKAKAEPPFTPGQIAIARDYRSLTERYHSSGVKGSSLETVSNGGSGGGSYMDAVIRDHERLATFHRRIGDGVAMEVRRVRPSKRGVTRRVIRDRALVDMVCLQDATLKDVLKAHGWSVNRQQIDAVLRALRGALDRMQGPRRKPRSGAYRFLGEM